MTEKELEANDRQSKWLLKTTTTIDVGWLLGPNTAIKVGGFFWGTSKAVSNFTNDEDLKEVLKFIGDISWDTAKESFYEKISFMKFCSR